MDEELERQIRSAFDAGDLERAATAALEGYGRELIAYLMVVMPSQDDAGEVFAQLSEDLWKGLPRFGWRCSFRTWAYAIARNAAANHRRSPHNQAARRVPLSKIGEVAAQVRSQTLPYLRTEEKDRLVELRRQLDPDDQELLVLRLNRGLSWKEIGVVLGNASPEEPQALDREAARFRQRYQTLKRRIRELADRQGLFAAEDADG